MNNEQNETSDNVDKTISKDEKQHKRTSAVWEYFKILDDKTKVECKLCITNKQFKHKNNSTTIHNLREHLKTIHSISPPKITSHLSKQDILKCPFCSRQSTSANLFAHFKRFLFILYLTFFWYI